ncbi:MAG: hypothetical protein RRA35_11720 [Desulfomonilia bacterium]|nr:hypothetical protein [Desulfomonilia bacterium]
MSKDYEKAREAALWMIEEIDYSCELTYEDALQYIEQKWGLTFEYDDEKNRISPKVLRQFRKLNKGLSMEIYWNPRKQAWMRR